MTSTCLPPFSYVKASAPGKVANACVYNVHRSEVRGSKSIMTKSLHRSLPFIVMNIIFCIAASLALN